MRSASIILRDFFSFTVYDCSLVIGESEVKKNFMNPWGSTLTEYFEDYVVGAERMTPGRTITETDVVIHAGHTGDFFPHHMDAEFARSTPFGQRIAHGTMIFAIGVGLTAGRINPAAFTYGYDKLRFIKPVFIGDTLRTRVRIKEKKEDPKRARRRQGNRSLRGSESARRSGYVLRAHINGYKASVG